MEESLPTGSRLIRKILLHTAGYSALAVAVISLYLSGLVRLSADQWQAFLATVAGVFLLLFPAMLLVHRGIFLTIQRCLDHRSEGTATREELARGFEAVCDFPRYWFVWGIGWWASGSTTVCLVMWILDPAFDTLTAAIIVCATLSIALVTDMYYFFTTKAALAPVRMALAAELGDIEIRRRLIRPVRLRTKILFAMVSMILVTVLFSGFLARTRSRRAVESWAQRVQEHALDALAGGDPFSFDEASRRLAAAGSPLALLLLSPAADAVRAGPPGLLAPEALAELGVAAAAGHRSLCVPSACLSWRRQGGDGALLVAVTPGAELTADDATGGIFAGLLIFSTLVAVGAAFLLARDVGDATATLQRAAARIASGDLTVEAMLDSEDEMGDLAHAFERMAGSLRGTVLRVAGAADRMHTAARAIASTACSVSEATETQIRGNSEAEQSMRSIDDRVRGIAGAAAALGEQIEGASSSLLEFEATGRELSDGAATLAKSVEEVGTSAEQMAQSIGRVEASSEDLVRVADDTSGNMQQAASGMRTVSEAVENVSELAVRVVELSEAGRARVRQTVEGMADIERATVGAQDVIRELAESASEIDGVIAVIDSVADETRLLALNAAIIAAQSGEEGRAFAVVANQIRDLAHRVGANTKTVTELVGKVQRQSAEAGEAIARGTASVQRGVEISRDADAALDEIARSARATQPQISDIATAVEEQTRAVAFVAESMALLRERSGQISAAIQEQSRSTELLRGNSASIGDVSQQLSRAAGEQSQGTSGITHNMHGIRESVAEINGALQEQSSACLQVVAFLSEIDSSTRSNQQSVKQLNDAAQSQQGMAEDLQRAIDQFRL